LMKRENMPLASSFSRCQSIRSFAFGEEGMCNGQSDVIGYNSSKEYWSVELHVPERCTEPHISIWICVWLRYILSYRWS
jgi:hypothetical protein